MKANRRANDGFSVERKVCSRKVSLSRRVRRSAGKQPASAEPLPFRNASCYLDSMIIKTRQVFNYLATFLLHDRPAVTALCWWKVGVRGEMPKNTTTKRGNSRVFLAFPGGSVRKAKKRRESMKLDSRSAQTAHDRCVERETRGKARRLHRWDPQDPDRGLLNPVADIRYSRTVARKSSGGANLRDRALDAAWPGLEMAGHLFQVGKLIIHPATSFGRLFGRLTHAIDGRGNLLNVGDLP